MLASSNLRSLYAGLCALVLVAVVAVAGASNAVAQGALNFSNITQVVGQYVTNSANGISFDIVAGPTPLKIYRIGFPGTGTATTQQASVFFSPGGMSTVYPPTSTGSFKPNSQWTHVGAASITMGAANVPVQLPLDINVVIPANSRMGFKIVTSSVRYFNSGSTMAAPLENGNADMTIYHMGCGGGTLSPPSVESWVNFPRAFGGTIWYDYDQFQGTHASLVSARVNGGGGAKIGNNTVEAVIRNMGSTALDATPIHAEYSTDGGTTWVGAQVFSFPSFPVLTNQTAVFTLPWNIATSGNQTLAVRLVAPTPIGSGTAQSAASFSPDLDVTGVATNPAIPALNTPITVTATVRNNGSFDFNGQPITLRYTLNGGAPVTQAFIPTTLATTNATETFSFTTPVTFAVAGNYTLAVEMAPSVAGDPDTLDSMSVLLDNVGIPFVAYAPTAGLAGTLGVPIYRTGSATATGSTSVAQMIYMAADLATLPTGAMLNNLAFFKANDYRSSAGKSAILRVWLENTTAAAFTAAATYSNFSSTSTLVLENPSWVLPETTGWINFGPFNQSTPFIYSGGNVIVSVEWNTTGQAAPVTEPGPSAATSPSWQYETIASTNTGRGFTNTAPTATTSVALGGITSNVRRPHARFFFDSPATPIITNPSLPAAFQGTSYSATLNAIAGASGPYTWTIASGALPNGLTLNPSTGVISGTPGPNTASATAYNIVVSCTDTSGSSQKSFSILVTPLTVTAAGPLPNSNAGFPYNGGITAVGGSGTYTFVVTVGSLPVGLNLNPVTGVITGTTATSAISPTPVDFTVQISDGTTTVTRAYSILVVQPSFELLTSAVESATAGTTSGYPINTGWHDQRLESIYLASELVAAGVYSGAQLSGLQIKVGAIPGLSVDQFRVRMQHTTSSAHPGTYHTSGWTLVFGPTNIPLASLQVGAWLPLTFTSPFAWNGVDNLLIEFTTDGTNWSGGGGVFTRSTTTVRSVYGYSDSGSPWPYDVIANGPFTATNVPSLKVEFPAPNASDVDVDAVTFGPNASTGPSLGSNTINVVVRNNGLTAFTGNFNLEYSVNMGAWVTNAPFTATTLGSTGATQTVSFTAPWVISSPIAAQSLRVRINPQVSGDPDPNDEATFNYTVDADLETVKAQTGPFIGSNNVVVTIKNSGTMSLNGATLLLQFSTDNGVTFGAVEPFTPTTLGGLNATQDFTFTAQWNLVTTGNYTLVARINTPLSGDPDTVDSVSRTYTDAGLAFEILGDAPEASSGGGTVSGYPFNTYWHDMRMESIYLASELTATGLYPSSQINGIQLRVSELPGRDLVDVRIRMQHTTNSVHPGTYATTGYTDCYGPASFSLTAVPPVLVTGGWLTFTFTTPFVWNGVDNLLIDYSQDNTAYTTGGGCFMRTTPGTANRHLKGNDDSGYTWPFDGMFNGGGSNSVPSMRFMFPPPSDPGVAVTRGGNSINDASTDSLGNTIYATLNQNITYALQNYGASQNLNISAVNISNLNNTTATVVTTPVGTPIAPLMSSNLVINVAPSAGPYSFNVELVTNSATASQASYTWTVSGNGFVNSAPTVTPRAGGGSSLLITELVVDDTTGGSAGEFCEVTNVSAVAVDVTGWTITIYDNANTAPTGFPVSLTPMGLVAPGAVWVIGEYSQAQYLPNFLVTPTNINFIGGFAAIVIRDNNNDVVDMVFFGTGDHTLLQPAVPASAWNIPNAPMVTTANNSTRRTGSMNNSTGSDWTANAGTNLGVLNPGLVLPFAGGSNLAISGSHPNIQVDVVSGDAITLVLLAEDIDANQNISILVDTATGGTITPAQAGFTSTFPINVAAGASPKAAVLLGTAAMSGIVNFTVTVADNGMIPQTTVMNLTVRVGSKIDINTAVLNSTFVRTNGRKDFYRGQMARPVDLTVSNDNNFAIQLNSVTFKAVETGTTTPITGLTFTVQNGPITLPANSTNVAVTALMDIAANASGSNGQSVTFNAASGTAVDPVNPSQVIVVRIGSQDTEFDLYDGPVPQPMQITTTSLAPAVQNVAYSQNLVATGGTQQYTWTIAANSAFALPTGLTLSGSGSPLLPATISGTPDPVLATPGTYAVTFECSDGAYVDTKTLNITVSVLTPLSFPQITLPNATEYMPYNMTAPFAATGGSLVYTYTIDPSSTDQLPAGLTLNPQTGFITGTPANLTAGTYSLLVSVDDGQNQDAQTVTLTIASHPLTWTSSTLPQATQTVAYNATLGVIGGVGLRIVSITSGSLPSGLTLNGQTGVISGVPTLTPPSAGTYNITFSATDSNLPTPAVANQTITLTVVAAAPLAVAAPAYDYAMVGSSYSLQLASTGGSENYTYSLHASSQALPNGVTLSASGELSGTPAMGADGRFDLVVNVFDGFQSITKNVKLAVLAKSADSFGISEVDTGTGYIELSNDSDELIDVSGWSLNVWVDGTSPINLPFDTIPGASLALPGEVVQITIGGTAGGFWPNFSTGGSWTATSSSNMAVQLLDIAGNTIDFVAFGTITRQALVDAANAAVEFPGTSGSEPNEMNGSANYSFDGNGWVGAATGTPGAYNAGLAAKNLAILKDGIRTATSGESYFDFTLAVGGVKPYSFSLAAPTAAWLSLNPTTGVFTGTVPTVTTDTTVQMDVTVTDAASTVVTETFELQIAPASTAASATFTVGNPEGQSFEGTVIDVPVTMTRATGVTDVRGFSFVINLPTMTADELAVVRVLPGPALLASGRTIVARDMGNNSIYISDMDGLAAPTANINDGVVAIIRFMVPADDTVMAPEDTYPVNISNVEVGRDAQGAHVGAGVNGSMVLSNYKPQDVNRDNLIDVVDVQLTVNIILASFVPVYTGQGDANGDTIVDVVDVQTIVNCILLGGC